MIVWDVEPQQRELHVSGESLSLAMHGVRLFFGPVTVNINDLAAAGWVLRMRQRTPLSIKKTRPVISIYPPDNMNHGFRIRPRSRPPYKDKFEVFEDVVRYASGISMSITKWETEVVRETAVSGSNFQPLVAEESLDPFEALRLWNDERVAAFEMPRTTTPPPPDNIIDFIEHLNVRDSVEMEEERLQTIKRILHG